MAQLKLEYLLSEVIRDDVNRRTIQQNNSRDNVLSTTDFDLKNKDKKIHLSFSLKPLTIFYSIS